MIHRLGRVPGPGWPRLHVRSGIFKNEIPLRGRAEVPRRKLRLLTVTAGTCQAERRLAARRLLPPLSWTL